MKKAVWISYDLGIKGDYNGLYAWLDDNKAIECGNSIAFLKYPVVDDLMKELKKDLTSKVNFKSGDRIYVIRRELVDGKYLIRGSFICGKRKSSPWEGYGASIDEIIDGNE